MRIATDHSGQSLLEVIVAMAIFGLMVAAISSLVLGGFNALAQGGEHTQAEALAQEAIEAVRSIKHGAYNRLRYSQSGVTSSSGQWLFSGEGTTEKIGEYTRTITIDDVCRGMDESIAECPGVYVDPHIKKVTVAVTWETREGVTNTVQRVVYLSNWDTLVWPQLDWSGGDGQNYWSSIDRYDQDDGNVVTSDAGQAYLGQISAGSATTSWPFDDGANYTYDNSKIEVTDGYAQLIGSGVTFHDTEDDGFEYTTDTEYDWTFDVPGDYVYNDDKIDVTGGYARLKEIGGTTVSGTTQNAGFTSNANGWTYHDWDQGGGDPNATGSWYSSGGNPGGYIDVNLPYNLRNKKVGGYWEQSFTTTVDDPDIVTCSVDWKAFSATLPVQGVDELYVAIYLETSSGEPAGSPVLRKDFTSTFDWESHSGDDAVDCSAHVDSAGTYYYKVALWIDGTHRNTGPIRVGFDNANVYWEDTSSGSYSTDSPTVYPTESLTSAQVQSWDGFTETASKDGGQIYYQLSDDDGASWQYWNGSAWTSAGTSSQSNTASVVDSNISLFSTSSEQIKSRAFLESDGTQFVQLDNLNIEFTPPPAVWSFNTWDVGGGEVIPTGVKQRSGGNPDSYANISVPIGRGDEVGGYWEQQFTVTANNPNVLIDFDYRSIDYNGNPNLAEIRIYVDNASGDPVNQVGSSILISSESDWTGVSTIDASSAASTTGVYYLKIAFWVETPNNQNAGPFTVGFDNVNLEWQSASYPSGGPTIRNNNSFEPSLISSWSGFYETAFKADGEIYYQLSDDDGASWQYWNGTGWMVINTSTDYNTADEINDYIKYFDANEGKLMFKAFLVSDGSQFVRLDNLKVSYQVGDINYHGNQFIIDSTTGAGYMSGANDVIDFRFEASTGGTVNSVRVYLQREKNSPVYRYGLQSDSGGEPSGTWLGSGNQAYGDYQATATGWQTINLNESASVVAGDIYHLVVQYQSGIINPGHAIELRVSDPNNFLHPFDNSDNSFSNVLWSGDGGGNWSVQGQQPIYILDLSGSSYRGNPYHEVSEQSIYGSNYHGQEFTMTDDVSVSSLAFYLSENSEGPTDNLYLTLYDITSSTNVITDAIMADDNDTADQFYQWIEYLFSSPIELINGHKYRLYLSSPGSDASAHYIIKSVYHDNLSALNSTNYDGTNSYYAYSTNGGGSWDSTNSNQDLSGFRFGITLYAPSGYLVSSAYNATSSANFTVIEWDQITPSCSPPCQVKLQIQTAPDNGGVPGIWSATWCGPDGEDGDESDYYTNSTGRLIHIDHNGDQWIRYKATLSGDSSDTPILEAVRIYYTL